MGSAAKFGALHNLLIARERHEILTLFPSEDGLPQTAAA